MKIQTLNKETIDRIKKLGLIQDPFGMFTRVHIPGHYVLGALERAGNEALLLGYLIFVKSGQQMMVEWIWVEPTVRNRGVGDALMKAAFRIAGGFDIPVMGAYLPYMYGRSAICPGEASFAGRYFGLGETEIPGQWVLSVRNLQLVSKRVKKLYEEVREKKKNVVITPLREVGAKTNLLLESLEQASFMEMNYALGDKREYLEDTISMVCSDETGKGKGAVLWQKTGKGLYLAAIGAEEEGLLFKLFLASILQIIKDYAANTLVRMELWTFPYAPFLRTLLGWNGGAVVMTGAVPGVLQKGPSPAIPDIGALLQNASDAVITHYLNRAGKAASDAFSEEAMEALAAGADLSEEAAEEESGTTELTIKEVAKLPLVKDDKDIEGFVAGKLDEVTLPVLREWIDTLVLQNIADAPPWLRIIPLEYYDGDTSMFYVDKKTGDFGLCLTHYEPESDSLVYVALDGSEKEDGCEAFRCLLAESLKRAITEYDDSVTVVIPDQKVHFVLDFSSDKK